MHGQRRKCAGLTEQLRINNKTGLCVIFAETVLLFRV